MSNIYNISEELSAILECIELNDGELTPELEQNLIITEAKFKDAVDSYTKAIKIYEYELAEIKAEKERLSNLASSKEKAKEKLTKLIANAITQFGETSKTGTKFIQAPLYKISVRNTEAIELNDEALSNFTNQYIAYFNWFKYSNQYQDIQEIDINDIIAKYNAMAKEELQPQFSIDDAENVKADLTFRVDLKDLARTEEGRNLITAMLKYDAKIKAKPAIDKKEIKDELKANGTIPAFAKVVNNQSLIIK